MKNNCLLLGGLFKIRKNDVFPFAEIYFIREASKQASKHHQSLGGQLLSHSFMHNEGYWIFEIKNGVFLFGEFFLKKQVSRQVSKQESVGRSARLSVS